MNINLDEVWKTWTDIDNAAELSRMSELEVAGMLIPQLISEIETLRIENSVLKKSRTGTATVIPEDYEVVYDLSDDDTDGIWGDTLFTTTQGNDVIENLCYVEWVREYANKFEVSGDGIVNIVVKEDDCDYELRKVRPL